MGTLEEIKRMQNEGQSEQDIIQALRLRGISPNEIATALTQSKIRDAVSSNSEPLYSEPIASENSEEMQPSIMSQPSQSYSGGAVEDKSYSQYSAPQYSLPQYPAQQYDEYPQAQTQQYPSYQPTGISPDTITEIAEQVIQERLADTRERLKQLASFKNATEAKMDYLDERLKRIEKIIDRLQLSILQKVGEYSTSSQDIKKELVETQKSFKSLLTDHKNSHHQK